METITTLDSDFSDYLVRRRRISTLFMTMATSRIRMCSRTTVEKG